MRPDLLRRDRRRVATPAFNSHVEAARLAAVNDLRTALTATEDAAGWIDAYSEATKEDRREATGIVERLHWLLRSIDPPDHLDGFVFEPAHVFGAESDISNPDFDSNQSPWTEIPEFTPPTGPPLSDYDTQETPIVHIDSSTEDGLSHREPAAIHHEETVVMEAAEPGTVPLIVIDEDDVPEAES